MSTTTTRPAAPRTARLETRTTTAGAARAAIRPTTVGARGATGAVTAGAAQQVHLTRRGRALLLVALVAVLFAAFSLGRSNSEAAPTAVETPRAAVEQITVQPGESLWAVARRVAPENDPREVMAQISRLNDLTSTQLLVGQQLLLPSAA